ncbi:hypothetical protein C9374_008188 [Naegleria lovaniensis]|uniref:Transcription initiation factor IIF subunit beta n=1 Tax=Naegleria lovaniensis TaxID=51637 RepID=A0AA88GFR4_NAELO|nr:uncharacterized protein C9374_008188 [Naegleria lovaniensis]KAG2378549.1 hypothetical protein C9374_008188 [Naegleria lovaniensis]
MNELKRKEPSASSSSSGSGTPNNSNAPTFKKRKQYIPLEGTLNASGIDQKVWLVKIPEFVDLAKYKDEETIGTVLIEENTLTKQTNLSLNINPPSLDAAGSKVTEFNLMLNQKKTPMYVFSMEKLSDEQIQEREKLRYQKKSQPLIHLDYIDTTEINVSGHIDKSCNAVVKLGKAYGELSRQRLASASQRDRKSIKVSEEESTTKKPSVMAKYRDGKQEEGPRDVRVREDEKKIKAKIFSLFKERQYWKSEELADTTDQPKEFIKSILSKICIYNKSGEYKGYYQLKPHYATDESKKIGTTDVDSQDDEWQA